MPSLELTPQILRIPLALASKFAVKDSDQWEELVCVGNLALVEYAPKWNPERGKQLDGYLYDCVWWRLLRATGRGGANRGVSHAQRWGRLASLDAAAEEDGIPLRDLIADPYEPPSPDDPEILERILGRLKPMERAALTLFHVQGLSHAAIATRLDVSLSWSKQLVCRALQKAKRLAAKVYMGRAHLLDNASRLQGKCGGGSPKQREAASRARRERAKAARAVGDIPASRCTYYLADVEEKTLTGPERSAHTLLAGVGIECGRVIRGAQAMRLYQERLGEASLPHLRLVRGSQARALCKGEGYRLASGRKTC